MSAENKFSEIFETLIMDHSSLPRGFGELPDAQAQADGLNPLAGDQFLIQFRITAEGMISQVAFSGKGSALATASASIMTAHLREQPVARAIKVIEDVLDWINGEQELGQTCNNELAVLLEIQQFPHRRNCASFAWRTALSALQNYE